MIDLRTFVALLLGLLVSGGGGAVVLGDMRTNSRQGEILQVEILVDEHPAEKFDPTCLRLFRPQGTIERVPWLTDARLTYQREGAVRRLLIVSAAPVNEPTVQIGLRSECGGMRERRYQLQLAAAMPGGGAVLPSSGAQLSPVSAVQPAAAPKGEQYAPGGAAAGAQQPLLTAPAASGASAPSKLAPATHPSLPATAAVSPTSPAVAKPGAPPALAGTDASDGRWPWYVGLSAGALLLPALFVLRRRPRRKRKEAAHGSDHSIAPPTVPAAAPTRPPRVPPVANGPGALPVAAVTPPAAASATGLPSERGLGERREVPIPGVAARSGTTENPDKPARPAKAANAAAPATAISGAALRSGLLDTRVEGAWEALELAEVMMTFGRVGGATKTLEEFITANPKEDVRPWIRLLQVYQNNGMRAKFDALTRDLNRNFNVEVVRWGAPEQVAVPADGKRELELVPLQPVEGQPAALEAMPHVCQQIVANWGKPECIDYLERLLRDNRSGQRRGFALSVVEEILFLLELAAAVAADSPDENGGGTVTIAGILPCGGRQAETTAGIGQRKSLQCSCDQFPLPREVLRQALRDMLECGGQLLRTARGKAREAANGFSGNDW